LTIPPFKLFIHKSNPITPIKAPNSPPSIGAAYPSAAALLVELARLPPVPVVRPLVGVVFCEPEVGTVPEVTVFGTGVDTTAGVVVIAAPEPEAGMRRDVKVSAAPLQKILDSLK